MFLGNNPYLFIFLQKNFNVSIKRYLYMLFDLKLCSTMAFMLPQPTYLPLNMPFKEWEKPVNPWASFQSEWTCLPWQQHLDLHPWLRHEWLPHRRECCCGFFGLVGSLTCDLPFGGGLIFIPRFYKTSAIWNWKSQRSAP